MPSVGFSINEIDLNELGKDEIVVNLQKYRAKKR